MLNHNPVQNNQRNVLGSSLQTCSVSPLTGFFRDGHCNTLPEDFGLHAVCALMTDEFLTFTKLHGNDLSTPRPGFPGLKKGDRWCLCALRWLQAKEAGIAPPVILGSTNDRVLELITLEELLPFAIDAP